MIRYLKNMEKEVIINNRLEEIPKINEFIEELSFKLPSGIVMSVNLAIEEAVTNIIRHAYPAGTSGEITLRVHIESGLLVFQIIDDGISFDPTATENTDVVLPLEQRLTKGLGLLLIRRTMDEVDYHTVDGKNVLTLVKQTGITFEPEATLKTNLCKIDGVTILAVEGRLDTANAMEFNAVIQPLMEDAHPNIILNCEGMVYISSSGIRSLVMLQKCVGKHNGSLTIEAVRPEIRKILDMTGCSSFLTIR